MFHKINWYERFADEGIWTEKVREMIRIYVVRYFVICKQKGKVKVEAWKAP